MQFSLFLCIAQQLLRLFLFVWIKGLASTSLADALPASGSDCYMVKGDKAELGKAHH